MSSPRTMSRARQFDEALDRILSGCAPACHPGIDEGEAEAARFLAAGLAHLRDAPASPQRTWLKVHARLHSSSQGPSRRPCGPKAAPGVVVLALALAFLVMTPIVLPGTVTAIVRDALLFIPGLGIRAAESRSLVAEGPIVMHAGDAALTVESLFADSRQTMISFALSGRLPAALPLEVGASPTPMLRDGSGRKYALLECQYLADDPAQPASVAGRMIFEPLANDLRSIDLIVPAAGVGPVTSQHADMPQEWQVAIPLVRLAQSGLPTATPQSATARGQGLSLQAVASQAMPDRTVILIQGAQEGTGRVAGIASPDGQAAQAAVLSDDRGNRYALALPLGPCAAEPDSDNGFLQNLYFEPLQREATQLRLQVRAVMVEEEGTVTITIPLENMRIGDTSALGRTVTLGRYQLSCLSATLRRQGEGLWLYVDVDPSSPLTSFSVRGSAASVRGFSGARMTFFAVPLEPGATEAIIQLAGPTTIAEGPWELTFPAR